MTPAVDSPVRIVVAGAGLAGQAHIERILREPEAELAGIVDLAPQAEVRAASLGVAFDANLGRMLEAVRPGGVVIALPNQSHLSAGLAAVRAGVPMLMEKPVCETVEQSFELAEASERAGVPVLVGHHRRHSPLIARAKEIIGSGVLGPIVAVNGFCWLLKPPAYFEDANSWRREPGGGPVLINLIHAIDDLRNLCGEIESVRALASNRTRGFGVEDTAGAVLGFSNGAIGTLSLSDTASGPWSWELTAGENPAYPRTSESCYYVAGTQGALSVPRLELWRHGPDGHWWTPLSSERVLAPVSGPLMSADPLVNQLRHFCEVARGKTAPLLDARGGARTLAITLEILESARSTASRQ